MDDHSAVGSFVPDTLRDAVAVTGHLLLASCRRMLVAALGRTSLLLTPVSEPR
jgi:hypothetical protein